MAEVPKLAARPTPYDKDKRTWLEFSFKLENYLALVNEKYVALLQDAESQPMANVPAGTDESSVLIRTLNHTLYALLATLTTGRSLRLVRLPNRNGFEVWRQFVAENAPKTAGRRFACCKLCCSRERATILQSLRKSGKRGNIRWTSTRNSRRRCWMMM